MSTRLDPGPSRAVGQRGDLLRRATCSRPSGGIPRAIGARWPPSLPPPPLRHRSPGGAGPPDSAGAVATTGGKEGDEAVPLSGRLRKRNRPSVLVQAQHTGPAIPHYLSNEVYHDRPPVRALRSPPNKEAVPEGPRCSASGSMSLFARSCHRGVAPNVPSVNRDSAGTETRLQALFVHPPGSPSGNGTRPIVGPGSCVFNARTAMSFAEIERRDPPGSPALARDGNPHASGRVWGVGGWTIFPGRTLTNLERGVIRLLLFDADPQPAARSASSACHKRSRNGRS